MLTALAGDPNGTPPWVLAIEEGDPELFQWFVKFVHTVNGARVAFLRPTGRPDLVAVGDASSGTLTIDSTNADYITAWYASTAHRRLMIVLVDGSHAYRTVEATVDNVGTQELTLDSPLAGAIHHIEMLELCRLEAGNDGVTDVVVTFEDSNFSTVVKARVVQR